MSTSPAVDPLLYPVVPVGDAPPAVLVAAFVVAVVVAIVAVVVVAARVEVVAREVVVVVEPAQEYVKLPAVQTARFSTVSSIGAAKELAARARKVAVTNFILSLGDTI